MLGILIVGLIITIMYFVIALYLLFDDDNFIKACGIILAMAYSALIVMCGMKVLT